MITRFYIDNYRCLNEFEIRFDTGVNMLFGPNGGGKSTVFRALRRIRNLVTGQTFLGGIGREESERNIPLLDFSKWGNSNTKQRFELTIIEDGLCFDYLMLLEQTSEGIEPRIIKESLKCDGLTLFSRDLDGTTILKSKKPFFSDWRQSVIPTILQFIENKQSFSSLSKKINVFFSSLLSVAIIRPDLRYAESESKSEDEFPDFELKNLISWYRFLANDIEWTNTFVGSLKILWGNDVRFPKLEKEGPDKKKFILQFEREDVGFGELSDGEKTLLALYMFRALIIRNKIKNIFIDEPDNYVNLKELQPWLDSLCDFLDSEKQVVLITHNSQMLDSPCVSIHHRIWREKHGMSSQVESSNAYGMVSPLSKNIIRGRNYE